MLTEDEPDLALPAASCPYDLGIEEGIPADLLERVKRQFLAAYRWRDVDQPGPSTRALQAVVQGIGSPASSFR